MDTNSQQPLFADQSRVIKKHSSIVQMGNITTLQERKAMNALIWIARDQLKRDPEQRQFRCDIGVLKRIIGINDKDTTELKAALRTLHAMQFEFNVLQKDDSRQRKLVSFMSEVTINEAGRGKPTTIEFEFPTSILEAVKNPNMFVKLDLVIIRGLESKHSIVLYELLKDYLNLGKFHFELNDFKKLMGIKPAQYNNFSMLRQRVLDTAIAEINSKTDIEAGYELDKQGRMTTGIRFRMRPKQTAKKQGNEQADIRQELLLFGLSEGIADELLQKHDLQYLQANIAVVKEQVNKGDVNNPAAYLLKAFQVDYSPLANAYTEQQQAKAAAQQEAAAAKAAAQQQLDSIKGDYAAQKKESIDQALQSLSKEKTAWLQAAFQSSLSMLFQKYYAERGLEHPLIQAQRYSYLAKELLPQHFHSQDNYIAYRL